MAVKTLEDEMMDAMAKDVAREIDEGIMANMLVETGWTPVEFYFKSNEHSVDVTEWLFETFKKDTWSRYGSQYIFKNKKDAEWFILRWR